MPTERGPVSPVDRRRRFRAPMVQCPGAGCPGTPGSREDRDVSVCLGAGVAFGGAGGGDAVCPGAGAACCSRGPRGRTWGAWSYFVLRGRTWTCAVVPSRARSYLREALRYDRVQLGTTARLRVRPGVPRYDRARGRPTNDAGRTNPQVRPRVGPAEDEVSRALRPVRDARPPA